MVLDATMQETTYVTMLMVS